MAYDSQQFLASFSVLKQNNFEIPLVSGFKFIFIKLYLNFCGNKLILLRPPKNFWGHDRYPSLPHSYVHAT